MKLNGTQIVQYSRFRCGRFTVDMTAAMFSPYPTLQRSVRTFEGTQITEIRYKQIRKGHGVYEITQWTQGKPGKQVEQVMEAPCFKFKRLVQIAQDLNEQESENRDSRLRAEI